MPALTPVSREWITLQARRANAYGSKPILRLIFLPINKVLPEDLANEPQFDVELILVCLRAGAWLNGEDWRPFVRYTIAKRLKDRADKLFPDEYAQYKKPVLDYQMNGGLNTTRDNLRRVSRSLQQLHTPFNIALARLIASITDPNEENTYIQPFHWIRTVLAASQHEQMYGMNLYNSEMVKQKETLCKMLRATIE
jgi:hypothetical protein